MKARALGKRLFSLLLVLSVFGYMGWRLCMDWPRVAGLFRSFHPFYFGLHLGLLALMIFLLTLGWHLIMAQLSPGLAFRDSARIWLVPNLGKYTPGLVIMLAGRVGMGLRHGIKEGESFCGLLIEHALLVLAALPFMLMTILMGSGGNSRMLALTAPVVFVACLSVVLSINRMQHWLNHLLKLIKRRPVQFHFPRRLTLRAFVVYLMGMGAYGVSGWMLCRALNLGADLSAFRIICAFVTSWAVGFLSFVTPGGLGVREGCMVLLLASSASGPQFMAFSILARLTWVVVELMGALLGLGLGGPFSPVPAPGMLNQDRSIQQEG